MPRVAAAWRTIKSVAGRLDHPMALVMIALMFLNKERIVHQDTDSLLSCNDLVQILRHK